MVKISLPLYTTIPESQDNREMLKIIGHRGARGLAPENTIAALKVALRYKVDEVEIDVRCTKDHVAILSHDPSITGIMAERLAVHSHEFPELRAHQPDLATLSEAIKTVKRRVPIRIEVKQHGVLQPVIRAVSEALATGCKPADFCFASFDYHILRALHTAFPDISLVVNERWSGVRATSRARRLQTRQLAMDQRFLWSGFIRIASHSGYSLTPYTVNDREKAERWERYGITGIVTDYPDRFVN